MGDLQDNGLVIRLPSMSIAIDDLLFGFRPARWAWKPLLKHLATGSFVPLAMRPGCSPRRPGPARGPATGNGLLALLAGL